ncbi:MAG: metabolite traffic protein EboE [Pirellula sp.]
MSSPLAGKLLGYCTNVHAGTDAESILANLRNCALPVRMRLGQQRLGVGLWFSQRAAKELLEQDRLDRFRDELELMGLVPYTINGFPQEDFHQSVVKHRVYQPAWWQRARLEYTRDLVHILDRLLPAGIPGSISTLPIGWGTEIESHPEGDLRCSQAAAHLLQLADELDALHERTGRRIRIALEPEPGCVFTDNASLRAFYEKYWTPPAVSFVQAARAREYLTICHDICHSAVMQEDQQQELIRSRELGISVGKVQVSSAILVPWNRLEQSEHQQALLQLAQFAEDRYLHQTLVVDQNGQSQLIEDLPQVLSRYLDPARLQQLASVTDRQWRIHFHVPIYVRSWGRIGSTQSQIQAWLELVRSRPDMLLPDLAYEVETYAWGVLPKELRTNTLDEGIAQEISWLESQI